MRPVYAHSFWYEILSNWTRLATRRSYRRVEVLGQELVPKDGAILFAPNHSNAMMDPLVQLISYPEYIVFGARADMFNKPLFAKMLNFVRIIPMVRERDGIRNVIQNYESMDTVKETLAHNVPFCMYCEGTHRTTHSLLPLKKGIMRTAFYCDPLLVKDIWIVPAGIDYGDYFRFRSTAILEYGKPINVSRFLRTYKHLNPSEQYRQLGDMLRKRMSGLISYIEDDEYYEGTWALTRVLTAGNPVKSLKERKELNQATISQINKLRAKKPIKAEGLMEDAIAFDAVRKLRGISMLSFGHEFPISRVHKRVAATLLSLPIFIVSTVMALPTLIVGEYLARRGDDKAFRNSFRAVAKIFVFPINFIILAILSFIFLPWWLAILALIWGFFSMDFFYDWLEYARVTLSDIKLFSQSDLKQSFDAIREAF